MDTACVVTNYLNYRIQKAGYKWQVSPTKGGCPGDNKVNLAVRKLCARFEENYKNEFTDMSKTCTHLGLERDGYIEVLYQLLEEDDLNWGRVIAVLAFSGQMCLYSMASKQPTNVDLVREWTYNFIHKNVNPWISANGGWKAFVDFANPEEEKEKTSWGTYLTGAVGAVCVFGALAFEFQCQ